MCVCVCVHVECMSVCVRAHMHVYVTGGQWKLFDPKSNLAYLLVD